VRRSNRYYLEYGVDYLVENLAWSADRILQTCEDPLCNKILEGMVGVSVLELDGPLVLKLMLGIIMDVDNIALCALTQSLQHFGLRTCPGRMFAQRSAT